MAMRVATFSMNSQMLTAALKTQSRMAEMQLQEASGLVSTDYGGLGSDARKLVSFEVDNTRAARYEAAATSASLKIDLAYDALNSIADALTELRASVTAAQSTSATDSSRSALITSASAAMDTLASLLNTEFDGQYIFSGGDGSTAPVDLELLTSPADIATADTSYYAGSGDAASVRVSETQTVSYGITADDEALEAAFRAMGVLAGASEDLSDIDLSAVLDLLEEAVDGVSALQGKLSVSAQSLEQAVASQQDLQSFYATEISELRDVDVTAVATALTAYETQLTASYSTLATIQSINLLDYLR